MHYLINLLISNLTKVRHLQWMLLHILFSFVYILWKPSALLFFLHTQQFWTSLKMFLQLFSRHKETFFIRTFNFSFQVRTMSSTKFRPRNSIKFAKSFLSMNIKLTSNTTSLLLFHLWSISLFIFLHVNIQELIFVTVNIISKCRGLSKRTLKKNLENLSHRVLLLKD